MAVEERTTRVDETSGSDGRADVARDQLYMQVVQRSVAHRHLIDALDTGECAAQSPCHVTAHGEEPGDACVVKIGEVLNVLLPHHDAVPGRAGIRCQGDSHIRLIQNEELRAEYEPR